MNPVAAIGLFVGTAVAEILGCYLAYLWLRHNASPWLLGVGTSITGMMLIYFGPRG